MLTTTRARGYGSRPPPPPPPPRQPRGCLHAPRRVCARAGRWRRARWQTHVVAERKEVRAHAHVSELEQVHRAAVIPVAQVEDQAPVLCGPHSGRRARRRGHVLSHGVRRRTGDAPRPPLERTDPAQRSRPGPRGGAWVARWRCGNTALTPSSGGSSQSSTFCWMLLMISLAMGSNSALSRSPLWSLSAR